MLSSVLLCLTSGSAHAYCLLESGEKNAIEHLYRDIYKDVLDGKNVFLKHGEHQKSLIKKRLIEVSRG